MKHTLRLTAAAAVVALLGACANTPSQPNAALEDARRVYGTVSNDPTVAQGAPVELDRARKALNRADEAWTDDQDAAETNHLAYIAKQLAVVARETGAQREAEARVRQASAERESVRAQARTTEARVAQSQAADAQARAAAAQAEAQVASQQAQNEAQRAQQLEQELQQLQARNTDRGMVITLQDVLFDVGEATLKPGAERTLRRVAEVLNRHPERRLLIEGYTDSTGSESYNMELSRRRAEAVEHALMRHGVQGQRIDIQPQGEAYPVADNNTSAGRQMNRRVELLFSDEQGQVEPR
ncbi:OmpA family protein [Schlegelella sp. S2-27]|uniref:OmpA family protein n=1 Tax=Caldimonas mangrovi TaxID=2944811 RepID=A0ABT0YVC9_9BURK|nr:OmpA family protein [Caldimonas mangrovi]MCM5682707.1 OmpA family protein [Caldimonas mangrovi]